MGEQVARQPLLVPTGPPKIVRSWHLRAGCLQPVDARTTDRESGPRPGRIGRSDGFSSSGRRRRHSSRFSAPHPRRKSRRMQVSQSAAGAGPDRAARRTMADGPCPLAPGGGHCADRLAPIGHQRIQLGVARQAQPSREPVPASRLDWQLVRLRALFELDAMLDRAPEVIGVEALRTSCAVQAAQPAPACAVPAGWRATADRAACPRRAVAAACATRLDVANPALPSFTFQPGCRVLSTNCWRSERDSSRVRGPEERGNTKGSTVFEEARAQGPVARGRSGAQQALAFQCGRSFVVALGRSQRVADGAAAALGPQGQVTRKTKPSPVNLGDRARDHLGKPAVVLVQAEANLRAPRRARRGR